MGATHRKLSTFLNALLDAGLEAERFVEPPAPAPTYLLWRAAAADSVEADCPAASRQREISVSEFFTLLPSEQ